MNDLGNPDVSAPPPRSFSRDFSANFSVAARSHLEGRPLSLVTIVDRRTAMVEQRWSTGASSGSSERDSRSITITGTNRVLGENGVVRYDTITYSLPQRALNGFTDEQGFARLPVRTEPRLLVCPVFQRLTDLILPAVEAPSSLSVSFMEQFTKLFCAQILQSHHAKAIDPQPHRGGLASWQRRKAIEVLSARADANVTLPTLARECGLSVSHFARSFKTTFGLPAHRWIILKRVERAKELLLTSNASLLQIAFDAGFCDQASFNRTFANVTGTSPGRWRKSYKV